MKNKIYHLGNCTTCQGILKKLNTSSCELQDIKYDSITEKQLDYMANLAGSYEALFSRKAIKYRTLKLKEQILTETDYRKLILEEYTFLKRPVIIAGKEIFIGSIKVNVNNAMKALK